MPRQPPSLADAPARMRLNPAGVRAFYRPPRARQSVPAGPAAEVETNTATKLWNTATGRELHALAGGMAHHLAFSEEFLDWDIWLSVETQLPLRLIVTATAMEGTSGSRWSTRRSTWPLI